MAGRIDFARARHKPLHAQKGDVPRTPEAEKRYIFKVSLRGRAGTWRRITMIGGQTLDDLHNEIFHAFGRHEEHLYSFYFPIPGTRGRDRLRTAKQYSHPTAVSDPGHFGEGAEGNAARTRIRSLRLRVGQRFEYLFDFGDSWWHDIVVEAIAPADSGATGSGVIESRGSSPRQYPADLFDEQP